MRGTKTATPPVQGLGAEDLRIENRPPHLPVGGALCYCPACGQLFFSEPAFARHRTKDFRCLTPAAMTAAGMGQNKKGQWIATARQEQEMDDDC